jgi:hypothetical protein
VELVEVLGKIKSQAVPVPGFDLPYPESEDRWYHHAVRGGRVHAIDAMRWWRMHE